MMYPSAAGIGLDETRLFNPVGARFITPPVCE